MCEGFTSLTPPDEIMSCKKCKSIVYSGATNKLHVQKHEVKYTMAREATRHGISHCVTCAESKVGHSMAAHDCVAKSRMCLPQVLASPTWQRIVFVQTASCCFHPGHPLLPCFLVSPGRTNYENRLYARLGSFGHAQGLMRTTHVFVAHSLCTTTST